MAVAFLSRTLDQVSTSVTQLQATAATLAPGLVEAPKPEKAPEIRYLLPAQWEQEWEAYKNRNARLRNRHALAGLLRGGIPEHLRKEVWQYLLGATSMDPQEAAEQNMPEVPPEVVAQIELDVLRTFPSDEFFTSADFAGPERLKEVLLAVARADPGLGYCQSLNFVCGAFLSVFPDPAESRMATQVLLQRLQIRNYFTDGMLQLRADLKVLSKLAKRHAPGVVKLVHANGLELSFICAKWFLSLFSSTLPLETVRCIWDNMLHDGIQTVFKVALALLMLIESLLPADARSVDEVVAVSRQIVNVDARTVLKMAYDPAIRVPRGELNLMRREAHSKILHADAAGDLRNAQMRRGGRQRQAPW